MLVSTEQVIKEYWLAVKEKYPGIPFDTFETICKTPFHFIKSQIERTDTPTITIKYLGKFKVFIGAVKKLIDRNTFYLKEGRIDQQEHDKRLVVYQKKLAEVSASVKPKKNKLITTTNFSHETH